MPFLDIQTNQNVTLELNLAGLGERMVAYLVDMGLIFGYMYLINQLFGQSDLLSNLLNAQQAGPYVLNLLLLSVPYWFYDLLFEVFNKGRTPGKMLMKMQVISTTGEPASMNAYLIRWLFRPIDIYGHLILMFLLQDVIPQGVYVGLLSVLVFVPGLVGLVAITRTKTGQRLGDLLAGTVLTKVKRTVSIQDTILQKTNKDYQVVYKNALKLSDRDVRLIKETLEYYSTSNDQTYVEELAKKAQDFLGFQTHQTSIDFLRTLIKDYNHLAVEQDGGN